MVPLVVKKAFMKYFGKYVNNSPTTTFSNIGPIKIADQYKKYIDKTYPTVNIYYILYYVLVTHTSIK